MASYVCVCAYSYVLEVMVRLRVLWFTKHAELLIKVHGIIPIVVYIFT